MRALVNRGRARTLLSPTLLRPVSSKLHCTTCATGRRRLSTADFMREFNAVTLFADDRAPHLCSRADPYRCIVSRRAPKRIAAATTLRRRSSCRQLRRMAGDEEFRGALKAQHGRDEIPPSKSAVSRASGCERAEYATRWSLRSSARQQQSATHARSSRYRSARARQRRQQNTRRQPRHNSITMRQSH